MGKDKTVTVFKSSLHFVPLIKVQAALEMTEAYSSSITVSKTV